MSFKKPGTMSGTYLSLFLLSIIGAAMTQQANLGKSQFSSNPILRYSAQNSLRLTPEQEGLISETRRKYREAGMIGAPEVVQLNQNLIRAIGGKKILDVGTFTGYSALGAALATPADGTVIGMDVNPQYFENTGRQFAQRAGVERKIDMRYKPAIETLRELLNQGTAGTWDFCFIDADKSNYDNYYELCLQLLRPGGFISVDNALWGGSVAQTAPERMDRDTRALHDLNVKIGRDQRVYPNLLPFADGVMLALKK